MSMKIEKYACRRSRARREQEREDERKYEEELATWVSAASGHLGMAAPSAREVAVRITSNLSQGRPTPDLSNVPHNRDAVAAAAAAAIASMNSQITTSNSTFATPSPTNHNSNANSNNNTNAGGSTTIASSDIPAILAPTAIPMASVYSSPPLITDDEEEDSDK